MPSDAEIESRTDTWARMLIDIIPEERLPDAFKVAFRLNPSSHAVNAYDLKRAWEIIADAEEKERRKLEAKKPKPCANVKYHIFGTEKAPVVYADPLNTGTDSIVPCPVCRAVEYQNWRKHNNALYGEHQPKTVLVKPEQSTPGQLERSSNLILDAIKEKLTPEQIAALVAEHNRLVCEVEPGDEMREAREKIMVEWDANNECFRRKLIWAKTYSAHDIRHFIERYKNVLAEREAARAAAQ